MAFECIRPPFVNELLRKYGVDKSSSITSVVMAAPTQEDPFFS